MNYLISAGENYIKLLPFFIILQLIIMGLCKRDKRTIPPGFVWGVQVLALLMIFLFVITGESGVFDIMHYDRSMSKPDQLNLTLFERTYQDRFGFVMNMIAFIPFGILLPTLWESFAKFHKTVAAGLILSVVIEITQLFNLRSTDVDDVFMNTLGTVVGYIVYLIVFKKHHKYFQLKNAQNCSIGVEYCGYIFVVCIFLGSYVIRPLINLWI